jgi:hypothetical protein
MKLIEKNYQSLSQVSHLLKEIQVSLQPQIVMLVKVRAKTRRAMRKRIPKRILTRKKKINLKRSLPIKRTKTNPIKKTIPKRTRRMTRSPKLLKMPHTKKRQENAPLGKVQAFRLRFHPLRLMRLVS